MQTATPNSFDFEEVDTLALALINRFYKQCRYPAKAGKGDQVYSLRHNGELVAAVKLMPKDCDGQPWLFLRAMCVLPSRQSEGIGAQFLERLSTIYKHPVYCYPFDHLVGFYRAGGFYLPAADQDLPTMITSGRQRLLEHGRKVQLMILD